MKKLKELDLYKLNEADQKENQMSGLTFILNVLDTVGGSDRTKPFKIMDEKDNNYIIKYFTNTPDGWVLKVEKEKNNALC